MKYARIAFQLLTTLPAPAPKEWLPGDSGRAAVWYPFVGFTLGSCVALAYLLLLRLFPSLLAAALTLALWALLTGGLHLDGLADCCDGLLYPGSPQRRLEIMKDSRMGAFGGMGLTLALLIKFAALASLPAARILPAVLLAASLARWNILLAGLQPLARAGGMGADFQSGLRKSALLWGALTPLALALASAWRGFFALGANLLTVFLALRFARARIGGVTGDVFGLLVEISEIIILTAFNV